MQYNKDIKVRKSAKVLSVRRFNLSEFNTHLNGEMIANVLYWNGHNLTPRVNETYSALKHTYI